ncbi:MAG: AAA family ATPase, partial [Saprospiraceae bacterium]
MRKLPISIQTFENIRQEGMIYVDKTKYIYNLVNGGKYYFLSRPRRFGKSLLLTTLKSYFQGKKHLFDGLYIYEKEKDWEVYPVIHIDYSLVEYRSVAIFQESLINHLQFIADEYDILLEKTVIGDRLVELVQKLVEKYQQQVVILVDEYDKPMVDYLTEEARFIENRSVLKSLYTSFKGLDNHLRFVMLTGVSRFSKISIFSGLNNLDDISMSADYSQIVGFTKKELWDNFPDYLQRLQDKFGLSKKEIAAGIQYWYNGFSFDGITHLHNPFSILALLNRREFENYWFSTGTPTFLIDLIKEQKHLPETFEGVKVKDLTGSSLKMRTFPLIPLLFQTGYLTIKKFERDGLERYFYLDYPNYEVKHSFLTYIAASFVDKDEVALQPEYIALRDALIAEDLVTFTNKLTSFLADIPSRLHIPKEAYYHSLVYLVLRLVGAKTLLEKETDKGRIDGVLEFSDKIYIIEFKFSKGNKIKRVTTLSQQAIKQIETNKYYEPYLAHKKQVILLGLGFLN